MPSRAVFASIVPHHPNWRNKNMSVDVKAEVVIERPRAEVAGIMFNPKCDTIWIGGLTNVFPLTPGSLKKGAQVERIGIFMGRAFSAMVDVMRYEPEQLIDMTINEPFEMKIRYELKDVPEGTLAKIRLQGMPGDLFQMPASQLSKAVLENITNDLKKLKKHVENGG